MKQLRLCIERQSIGLTARTGRPWSKTTVHEALRCIPHRPTKMRSRSFYRYFHLLKQLGWVEAIGEEEGSVLGVGSSEKVRHIVSKRLTAAELSGWERNPLVLGKYVDIRMQPW